VLRQGPQRRDRQHLTALASRWSIMLPVADQPRVFVAAHSNQVVDQTESDSISTAAPHAIPRPASTQIRRRTASHLPAAPRNLSQLTPDLQILRDGGLRTRSYEYRGASPGAGVYG
jgi:hypothetical protein